MFTINVADKHKVLSDLMNIFGKLHQKGFSDEQILNICHTFFKSEVEDNIDFCLKINKLESCASRSEIDEPTLHFKINIDFINKVLKIQKAVESIRELSSAIFTLDGEKVVLDSNTDILKGISNTEKPKQPSLPEMQPEVNPEEVKKLTENVETPSDEVATEIEAETEAEEESATEEIVAETEPESEPEPEIEQISEEVEKVAEIAEVEEVAEVEPESEPEISEDVVDLPAEPESEVAAEIEAEAEAEIETAAEIVAEVEPEPEPEMELAADLPTPTADETEIAIDAEISEENTESVENIENIETAESSETDIDVDLSAEDLNLDFPIAEEDSADFADMQSSENIETETPSETDLPDLGSLDEALDFDISAETSTAPTNSANAADDDILLEISDPTEEDIAALQEKLNQLEQQQ